MSMKYKISGNSDTSVAVSLEYEYQPMVTCPRDGTQVLILLAGGVCVRGSGMTIGAIGWAPFPSIPDSMRKCM